MSLDHEKNCHGYLSQANKARNLWELIESVLISYFKLVSLPRDVWIPRLLLIKLNFLRFVYFCSIHKMST